MSTTLNPPESRNEQYLGAIVGQSGVTAPATAESREEVYLKYLLENGTAREAEIRTIIDGLKGGMIYKGSVATVDDLPTPSASIKGHVYTVLTDGHEHVCDGTQWVDISGGGGVTDVQINGTSALDGTVAKIYIEDVVNSTATNKALSSNMGKNLQDQVNNLKNIGRFLAIWDATTGLPLTDPVELPYAYRTGDYYRVGTVGTTNYKPTGSSYNHVASTTVESGSVEVGWVYYYDGSQWLAQSAGGGGTVQDVQVNGTSIVASGTGIANIPKASSSTLGVCKVIDTYGIAIGDSVGQLRVNKATDAEITTKTGAYKPITPDLINITIKSGLGNYTGTAFSSAEKTTARNTIGAVGLEAYDSTATPVDGVLYYVAE